jgi:hypothetical protein
MSAIARSFSGKGVAVSGTSKHEHFQCFLLIRVVSVSKEYHVTPSTK